MAFSITDVSRNISYISTIMLFVILVLFVSFRGTAGADGYNYLYSWEITPTIYDADWRKPDLLAYHEPGYYVLTIILKSISDSPIFYFAVLSVLSMGFLLKSLRSYSIYPLVGLLVYMSRFFILRDFNQIRAAVAISIIVYSTKYIDRREGGKFFWLWLLALCFHTSMIIVPFFYLLNRYRPSKKQIYIIITSVFCISIVMNKMLKDVFDQIAAISGALSAYSGDTEMALGMGMANPMIYFQLVVLIVFTACEPRLKEKQQYYYTIRNGYLFSTILLMLFSSLLVVGARLSTIFATYEIIMIPAILSTIKLRSKLIVLPLVYIFLALLFAYNLLRAGDLTYGDFTI